MATKKAKASKGKRYSPEERQKIIDFVDQYNADNRRGGASAAAKKFGVSPLTLSSWMKSGAGSGATVSPAGSGVSIGNRGKALAELSKLDAVISAKRKELDALEKRFQKLKESL